MKGFVVGALVGVSALVAAGCATSPERLARMEEAKKTAPLCWDEDQCTRMWEAAQVWVARNSGYKIQIATTALIETYNSNDTRIAMRVTKQHVQNGRYVIQAEAFCGNPFGCVPDALDHVLRFNAEVGAIQ